MGVNKRRSEKAAERSRQVQAPDETTVTSQHTFLQVLSREQVKAHYEQFYTATSKAALAHHTCAVCARSRTSKEQKTREVQLDQLPNSHRLTPSPVQQRIVPPTELTRGLLLGRAGFRKPTNNDEISVCVCEECFTDLTKAHITGPPRHSLANDLWTGPTPWELEVLTLPERLLISLNFTRVYIIKLQPKAGSSGYDPSSLQSALVGNVIAYEHNMPKISAMVNGDILPHKPDILASLISIALVSVGVLRKSWLRNTFQVRRNVVQRALIWLKQHNPYYKDITIDESRVAHLPSSDVPEEITACIRRDDDPNTADRERAGYVPTGETSPVTGGRNTSFVHPQNVYPSLAISTGPHDDGDESMEDGQTVTGDVNRRVVQR